MLLVAISGTMLPAFLAVIQDFPLPQVASISLFFSVLFHFFTGHTLETFQQIKNNSGFRYNLGDYSGEIVSEVMAQRQPIKPTYAIPIIPVANSSPFKHQEAMELKEFKVKVSNVNNRVTDSCCYACKIQLFRMGEGFLKLEIG